MKTGRKGQLVMEWQLGAINMVRGGGGKRSEELEGGVLYVFDRFDRKLTTAG